MPRPSAPSASTAPSSASPAGEDLSSIPEELKIAGLSIERKALSDMLPHPRNKEIRVHPPEGSPEWVQLANSLEHDYFDPIVWNATNGFLVSGHLRVRVLLSKGYTHADAVIKEYDEGTHMARMIAANRGAGEDDLEGLGKFVEDMDQMGDIDLSLTGLGADLISDFLDGETIGEPSPLEPTVAPVAPVAKGPGLVAEFGAAPFSVLDARSGPWQERKRAWLDMGLESELGRGDNLLSFSFAATQPPHVHTLKGRAEEKAGKVLSWPEFAEAHPEAIVHKGGTSIFDPALCELIYRWWCPGGGKVLDPFAGGSVRGLVAGYLGLNYTGIDLRAEQIEENEKQAESFGTVEGSVDWITGDSRNVPELVDGPFDFLMSCPPYADLEVYSDDPQDLSKAGSYEEFLSAYREIIAASVAKLKPNAFAVWVVGEIRAKNGAYRGFVPDTIRAFEDAGMDFYNEAILVTPVGSLPMRVRKQFEGSRKLGKTHQNVLVFRKGDAKKISARCSLSSQLPEEEPEPSGE